jgi:hypothetical protein
VRFSVHDTGKGMSAAEFFFPVFLPWLALIIYANLPPQIGQVFQPFQRGAQGKFN